MVAPRTLENFVARGAAAQAAVGREVERARSKLLRRRLRGAADPPLGIGAFVDGPAGRALASHERRRARAEPRR
jgi:hypothetical protein